MELGNRTSASVYTLRRRSGDCAADLHTVLLHLLNVTSPIFLFKKISIIQQHGIILEHLSYYNNMEDHTYDELKWQIK